MHAIKLMMLTPQIDKLDYDIPKYPTTNYESLGGHIHHIYEIALS